MDRLRTLIGWETLATLVALVIPSTVLAQEMWVPCTGQVGCGAPPENTLYSSILPFAAMIMIELAAGGAVLCIVISGVRMLLSYGDDSKVGAARKGILYGFGGLALAITSASIVSFVTSENYGQANPADILFGQGGIFASVLRIILVLFNVSFVIVILLAGIRMVLSQGNADEFKKGGEVIKWAIIGAIIVNLARVLVQAFLNLAL